jgi:hypothetical protein
MNQVEMAKLDSMMDCAASAMLTADDLENLYRKLVQLKNSVVLEEDRQALETMIRSVSKAHQQAKKLQESLTSQCGKMEQESLQRRKNGGTVLFAAPSARRRVWWNPFTWKN